MGAMVAPVRSLEPAEGMKRIEARVRTSLRVKMDGSVTVTDDRRRYIPVSVCKS